MPARIPIPNAMKAVTSARLTVMLVLGSLALAVSAKAATSGANGVHDPSRILESEGRFYNYGTGGGSRSSADGLV